MSDDVELQPCGRFEWERIIRRCQIHPMTKLVAYTLAQFASPAGTHIRPGTRVVAATCGVSERVAERRMAELRGLGLIRKTANGGGPQRRAAMYRLTIPADLMERVSMLEPDEATPATLLAGVAPDDEENSRHSYGGSSGPETPELPPFSDELPPFPARTPANDPPLTSNVPHHHPTDQPIEDHPIRDLGGLVTSARPAEREERLINLPADFDLRSRLPARRRQGPDHEARAAG